MHHNFVGFLFLFCLQRFPHLTFPSQGLWILKHKELECFYYLFLINCDSSLSKYRALMQWKFYLKYKTKNLRKKPKWREKMKMKRWTWVYILIKPASELVLPYKKTTLAKNNSEESVIHHHGITICNLQVWPIFPSEEIQDSALVQVGEQELPHT